MFLGQVIGEVWATRKMKDLEGKRLLVIAPVDERAEPPLRKVTPVVAADPLGADLGEFVVVAFGKAARVACGGDGDYSFEAAVVGIVDRGDVPDRPWFEERSGERDDRRARARREPGGGR